MKPKSSSPPDFVLVCPGCNYEFKMHYPKGVIPIAAVDALIASLKAAERIDEFNYYNWNAVQDVILTLEDIKKESEEMIPLATVDALIHDCKNAIAKSDYDHNDYRYTEEDLLFIFEKLKKEAIIPEDKENKPLEQRILDRIAFLESSPVAGPSAFTTKDGLEWSKELHEARIDELRKLVQ